MYTENLDKANVLNNHFSSVFTTNNTPLDQIPLHEGRFYPDIAPLITEANGIKLLLQNLDFYKSTGS